MARHRTATLIRLCDPTDVSDHELLALLLHPRTGSAAARRAARLLLERFGGLRALSRSAPVEWTETTGVGPTGAAALCAALEIGRRVAARPLAAGRPLRDPVDVHRHLLPRWRDAAQERFVALLLDGRHRLMGEVEISRGTLLASLVHPREVFRPALRSAAAALILAHNHPSGDPQPSPEDREVTLRLCRAGELLGVRVLDHVIVAERGHFSFAAAGEIERPGAARAQLVRRSPAAG